MPDFEHGQNIEYLHDGEWRKGTIHGIKTHETLDGVVTRTTYLVDTGKDQRLDQIEFNYRDRELNKRINSLVANGTPYDNALKTVLKQTDLPVSKLDVETVRQPELIEVAQASVKVIPGN